MPRATRWIVKRRGARLEPLLEVAELVFIDVDADPGPKPLMMTGVIMDLPHLRALPDSRVSVTPDDATQSWCQPRAAGATGGQSSTPRLSHGHGKVLAEAPSDTLFDEYTVY
jgi:hypothetical protein